MSESKGIVTYRVYDWSDKPITEYSGESDLGISVARTMALDLASSLARLTNHMHTVVNDGTNFLWIAMPGNGALIPVDPETLSGPAHGYNVKCGCDMCKVIGKYRRSQDEGLLSKLKKTFAIKLGLRKDPDESQQQGDKP